MVLSAGKKNVSTKSQTPFVFWMGLETGTHYPNGSRNIKPKD